MGARTAQVYYVGSPAVTPRATIEEMALILARHGVRVSFRPFHSVSTVAGGVVKLGAQSLVVINGAAPIVEQLMALAEALCSLDIELALLPHEIALLVAKAHARRRWRRRRLLGLSSRNKLMWQLSRSSTRYPGIHACKRNDKTSF